MNPVDWRKLQEATADAAKSLWWHYKECRHQGFSRWQAFDLTKILFRTIMQSILLGGRREE